MATLQPVGASDKHHKHHDTAGQGFSGTEQESQAADAPSARDALSQAIREVAYCLAAARGFEPGHELDDWVEAERQVVAASNPESHSANEAHH